MSIGFYNIFGHVVPMDDFVLKWRFTEEKYTKLPDQHLNQLKPLDNEAATFLWDYINRVNLHNDFPFKKDLFRAIDTIRFFEDNKQEVKKWLYQRGLPFDKHVFLSWSPTNAMIVPWKLFVKYFDSFYYGVADDLTIIDESLTWALLFYHEHQIYFGTNKDFIPIKSVEEVW